MFSPTIIMVVRVLVDMEASEPLRWTDADTEDTIATKRVPRGNVELRCSICGGAMEHASGPRGDGQVRTTRLQCENEVCEGSGHFNHVRTENPSTKVHGDIEWRMLESKPWERCREVPTPLRCDFCGFEGSPPEEEYKYSDHGYEPADGYETVFEKVKVPEHLTRDHDYLLQCPRCTRFNRLHSFKDEFTRDRTDPEDYVDEDDLGRYLDRDGEIRQLDRVRWQGHEDEGMFVVLLREFPGGRGTTYKIANVEELREAAFGFPSIYMGIGPERIVYRAVERSVPIHSVNAKDLEFVHRGPLVVRGYASEYDGGVTR